MTGSRKWPATAWRTLLDLALPALDEIGPHVEWTFTGGTALALRIDHRISYDIDIQLENASHLAALSPNRNKAARAICDRWQEPGHCLELEHEQGAIDFILAARQTSLVPWLYTFRDREIPVDEPAEILAKKLRYRGSMFMPRDIFDVLAIHRFDPSMVKLAVAAVPQGARRTIDRIRRIADRYRETIEDEVNPTASGAELLEADPIEAAEILSS